MALSLVRSSLSSSSLSISPREEIEMRLLEGNIGLEAVKLLMGIGVRKHDAHQGDLWRERGKNEARQVERGLGKAVSDRCLSGSFSKAKSSACLMVI